MRALLSGLDAPCAPEPCEPPSDVGQFEAELTLDARHVETERTVGGSDEDYLSDEDHPRWDDEPEGEPASEQPGEGEPGGPPVVDPPSDPSPSVPSHQSPVPGSQLPPVAVPIGTGTVVVLPATAIGQPAGASTSSAGADRFLADEAHGRRESWADDGSSLATGRWLARSSWASELLGEATEPASASRTAHKAGLGDDRRETGAVDQSFEDPLFLAELASLDGSELASELALRLTAPSRVRSGQDVAAAGEPRGVSPTRTAPDQPVTERPTVETVQVGQAWHDVEPQRVSVPAGRHGAMLVVPADAASQLRELDYDSLDSNAPAIATWKHDGPVHTGSVLYLRTNGTPAGFRELEVALPATAEQTAQKPTELASGY